MPEQPAAAPRRPAPPGLEEESMFQKIFGIVRVRLLDRLRAFAYTRSSRIGGYTANIYGLDDNAVGCVRSKCELCARC